MFREGNDSEKEAIIDEKDRLIVFLNKNRKLPQSEPN
jgi:hypothetical protein